MLPSDSHFKPPSMAHLCLLTAAGWFSNLKINWLSPLLHMQEWSTEVCSYRDYRRNKGCGSAEPLNWELKSGVKHYPINDREATQGKLAEGTFIRRQFSRTMQEMQQKIRFATMSSFWLTGIYLPACLWKNERGWRLTMREGRTCSRSGMNVSISRIWAASSIRMLSYWNKGTCHQTLHVCSHDMESQIRTTLNQWIWDPVHPSALGKKNCYL